VSRARHALSELPLCLLFAVSTGNVSRVRTRTQSKRVGGKLAFVHLVAKGDIRQWFDTLNPVKGVLRPDEVKQFCSAFCASVDRPEPSEQISEVLELVPEFKFHDFVQLVLLITKPMRQRGILELDDELRADEQDSTR
jgi:hypothetical protein